MLFKSIEIIYLPLVIAGKGPCMGSKGTCENLGSVNHIQLDYKTRKYFKSVELAYD